MQLTPAEILQRLGPFTPNVLWGLWLWVIIFLAMWTILRQSVPNTNVLIMLAAVVLIAFIDKVGVGYPVNNLFGRDGCKSMPLFFMRIGMFVLPMLAISISKSPKSRRWGIICAVMAVLYFFVRGIVDWKLIIGGASLQCNFF